MSIHPTPTGRIAVLLALLLAACTAALPEPALEDAATSKATEMVSAAPATVGGVTGEETMSVRMELADYERIAPLDAVYVVTYTYSVWLELTQAGYEALLASGADFEAYTDDARLNLRDYEFDTRFEEPDVPAEQRAGFAQGVPAFHVVQFMAPMKSEWSERLEELGVERIQAHPPRGYVVRMLPEQAPVVEELDFVRWVGPYHPAFKMTRLLQRVLREAEVEGVRVTGGIVENVVVEFYYKENGEPSIASTTEAIKALGGELLSVYPYVRAQVMLGMATFRLPRDAIVPVAQLNDVLILDYSYPEPVLDVEP